MEKKQDGKAGCVVTWMDDCGNTQVRILDAKRWKADEKVAADMLATDRIFHFLAGLAAGLVVSGLVFLVAV